VCDASTCPSGCCAGSVCVSSPDARQCGRGGAACHECEGCQRCSATGECELDPESHWELACISAQIESRPPDDFDWDPAFGAVGGRRPDPFCQFEMPPGSGLGITSTVIDSLMPVWNQPLHPVGTTLRAGDLMAGGMPWIIWVGDEEDNARGEIVCTMFQPMPLSAFEGSPFIRSNFGSCNVLTVQLTCRP
jgi:hypothetical protein